VEVETSIKVSKLITQIPALEKEIAIRTLIKIIVIGTKNKKKKKKENNECTFSSYFQYIFEIHI
jgi:hypothetical protein